MHQLPSAAVEGILRAVAQVDLIHPPQGVHIAGPGEDQKGPIIEARRLGVGLGEVEQHL